jgi:hypothetical protein
MNLNFKYHFARRADSAWVRILDVEQHVFAEYVSKASIKKRDEPPISTNRFNGINTFLWIFDTKNYSSLARALPDLPPRSTLLAPTSTLW